MDEEALPVPAVLHAAQAPQIWHHPHHRDPGTWGKFALAEYRYLNAVWRICIILIRIRFRIWIQDVKKFVTDPDPGKNHTDPDPVKKYRPKYEENL